MTLSPLALLITLAASLGWVALDTLRKTLAQRMPALAVVVWLFGVQALGFAAWAALSGSGLPQGGYLAPGLIMLGLNMLSNWMFIEAVRVSPLSLTIPLLSFTPVFTALLALPIVGEAPSGRQAVGIGVVVVGAVLLNAPRMRAGAGGRGLLRAFMEERGVPMMLGVALIWSVVAPMDKLALTYAALPVHAAIQTGGVSLGLALLCLATGRGALLRAGWPQRGRVLLTAAVGAAALALQLAAFQLTLVSAVEAIKRVVGLVGAVILGRALFQEAVSAHKVAAVALMAVGTALILV